MKLIQFYRNEIPTDDGDFLEDILTWSYEQLEGCHSYVQWMFPMKEGSMFHPEVPKLTDEEIVIFRQDPELQEKVRQSMLVMLDFLGMGLSYDDPPVIGFLAPGIRHKNPQWWLKRFNHNFLRVTRILKSLRYQGLESYSNALFKTLSRLQDHPSVTENSFGFWEEAANGPLP